ncbi:hypothetical protein ACRRTK_011377 [Alexandromys fortis]
MADWTRGLEQSSPPGSIYLSSVCECFGGGQDSRALHRTLPLSTERSLPATYILPFVSGAIKLERLPFLRRTSREGRGWGLG